MLLAIYFSGVGLVVYRQQLRSDRFFLTL